VSNDPVLLRAFRNTHEELSFARPACAKSLGLFLIGYDVKKEHAVSNNTAGIPTFIIPFKHLPL
jgi:hypothetical protein